MSGPLTVTVWGPGHERIATDAWPTPVPGLVINRNSPGAAKPWVVTHAASGAGLALCGDPEEALAAAIEFGTVTDWTQSGTSLRRSAAIRDAYRNALRRLGIHNEGYPVPGSLIRAVDSGRVS